MLQTGKAEWRRFWRLELNHLRVVVRVIFLQSDDGNGLSSFMMTSLTLGYFAGHKPSATIFDSRTRPSNYTGRTGSAAAQNRATQPVARRPRRRGFTAGNSPPKSTKQ